MSVYQDHAWQYLVPTIYEESIHQTSWVVWQEIDCSALSKCFKPRNFKKSLENLNQWNMQYSLHDLMTWDFSKASHIKEMIESIEALLV